MAHPHGPTPLGRRIAGLRYDPDAGYAVIELADGDELWVSADREGCHVLIVGHGERRSGERKG